MAPGLPAISGPCSSAPLGLRLPGTQRANRQRVGTVPYGYDLADDSTTLNPNEFEAMRLASARFLAAHEETVSGASGNLGDRYQSDPPAPGKRPVHVVEKL